MHKYTHAWLAFKAIERLQKVTLTESDRRSADSLVLWFKSRKDGVINGAWYPDAVIKDNATSHVLKFSPSISGEGAFRSLPSTMLLYVAGRASTLYQRPYTVDPGTNLPQRCEALAHSAIDNLRIQRIEKKGSPVVPTDNHIALILFMLSHYVADAHVPLHCDNRRFSEGAGIHAKMEDVWEQEIESHFDIDVANERFFYDRDGYPLSTGNGQQTSFLKSVEDTLTARRFGIDWGQGNGDVMEYMEAICQYSYLLSFAFIPPQYDETNVDLKNWQDLPGQTVDFDRLTVTVLSDAIDSISRVWLRVWRRYREWLLKIEPT